MCDAATFAGYTCRFPPGHPGPHRHDDFVWAPGTVHAVRDTAFDQPYTTPLLNSAFNREYREYSNLNLLRQVAVRLSQQGTRLEFFEVDVRIGFYIQYERHQERFCVLKRNVDGVVMHIEEEAIVLPRIEVLTGLYISMGRLDLLAVLYPNENQFLTLQPGDTFLWLDAWLTHIHKSYDKRPTAWERILLDDA